MGRRFIIVAGMVALFVIVSIALPEATVARAQRFSTPIFIGYHGGDDWEPDIAADREGHVYVAWAHYGGVPGCDTCSNPAAMIEVSTDRGGQLGGPRPLNAPPLGGAASIPIQPSGKVKPRRT